MTNKIILSICIPTYNRAEILDQTLLKLFSNPDFDKNKVEVIVSNNASKDNTDEVVLKYPEVKYYKNSENIRDKNYSLVLGYATGRYLKLFNDTLEFKPQALKKIIDIIEKNDEKENLFFYANLFTNFNCKKKIESNKELINEVSYFTTWILNFGVWREDFKKIENKDRYAKLQFAHVDWTYKLIKNGKNTIIYFEDLFNVVIPKKKGGYNIFNTFLNNYLHIIKLEKLPRLTYEREKYRLFKHFVYPWSITLLITDIEKFNFEIEGFYKIIFRKYWYTPYFYFYQLLFFLKKFKNETLL